ncbi:MAG: MarR family transcriptional regulator [Pseudobdellovibrio sp.]
MRIKKPSPLHLDQQLCFALYTASRLMIQNYTPLLKELDLTYPQYLVMLVLWKDDQLSVKDIGLQLKLDSGTLSPLLKKLQTKGLLKKIRSTRDERSVAIALTEKGIHIKKIAEKIPTAMFCKLSMKEKDFAAIRNSLQNLILHLETIAI